LGNVPNCLDRSANDRERAADRVEIRSIDLRFAVGRIASARLAK
jgi:hypothetical protein